MLESIASAILSKVLGDYVKGFEAKNLKFSWNGELSLTDLELSTTALDNFEIPIRIKAGSIGKLHLLIPWRELGTKPSIVRIERVFIILGPKSLSEYDEATAQKREQLAKERKLQYVELVKQTKNQNIQKAADNDSFLKRLVTTVVNNLQVYIDKIHIRYEDDQTNPERPFCCGVTLEHLHAQSTDRNWKPMIADQTEPLIYKLITLKNLAAYWNPFDSFLQYSSIQEMRELMEILIYTDDHDPEHVYVIEPVSSELKVVLNKSDLPDMLTPKAKARCTFDRISIAVRENQYVDFVSLMKRLIRYRKGSRFRKWRPKTSVKEDPKAWWGFVGNAVLSEVRERKRKWTWEYIKQRKVDKLAYIKLWKKAKKKKKFTEKETTDLKRLEEKLSFEDILFFRTLTDVYLRKEASSEKTNKPKSGFTGWISSWFSKSDDDTLEIPYLNVKVGDNEWKEIYEAIQYQEKEDTGGANKPPADWVQIQADFMLGVGSVTMQNEKGESIANVAFEALQLGLLLRDKWTSFKAELDSLELTDFFTKNTRFSQIIAPQRRNQKLFDFRLELNPVGQNFDTGVYLVTKPMNIVYNYPLIHRVISFIVDPLSSGPSRKKKSGINLKSESQLDFLLKLKKTLYLDLDIHAPNILMPENVVDEAAPMLVAILGQFKMNTDLSQMTRKDLQTALKTQTPDLENEEWLRNFYDSYNLKVSSLQILLATSAQKNMVFKEVERNNITVNHLLEPIDAEVTLRLCKINAEELSNVRLDSTLPTLRLKISAERLSTLINLILAVVDQLEAEKSKSSPKIEELPMAADDFDQEAGIEKFTQNIIDISVPAQSNTNVELIQEDFKGNVFKAELKIPEAVVVLYRQEQDTNVEFAVLMLNGIGLELSKLKYEFSLTANLNNLIIEDLLQPYGKDYRYLAHSTTMSDDLFNNFVMDKVLEAESNLILVQYTNISKDAPAYENTDQFLHCDFNALSLVVNRHTVAILINFFSSITVRKKDALPVQAGTDNQTIVQANAGKKIDPNHTTIRITVQVKGITLLLNGDDGADKALPLARAALSNSAFELNVKDAGLAIEGHLGNLNIKDLRASPKYPTILDIKGDHMIDFMFSITPCLEFSSIKDEYNIYIKVSNVRLIYIERFISELTTYLAVFGSIFEATKQKVTEYLGNLYQNPTKVLKYRVELMAPIVIVPQSSVSSKVLVADLGKISIQNGFTEIKRYSSMIEEIAIKLKHASITTGSLVNAEVHPTDDLIDQDNKILENLSAVLCVERALDPKGIQHEIPDIRVNIHIPSIAVTVSPHQLKFVLDMWSENLLHMPSDQQISEVRKRNAANMAQKAHAAEKSVAVSVWTTMALNLEIPLISLTLIDVPLHLNKNIPLDAALPEPLAQLELTLFELVMNTTSADTMILDVDVSTIKVYDMRPNSPVVPEFQTFIAPITRHDEASRSQLVVKYLRHSNGKQDIIINNDRFRAILIPEVIMRMQAIIMTAQQQLMTVLDKRGKLVALLNPELARQQELNVLHTKGLTVSEAQKQVGMSMRLTITKPQFCIVEDLTKDDSKVFIIHTNLTLNMANSENHLKMSLTLQGTEIFKTAMNIRSTIGAVEIMEPFDTAIEMKSDPDNFDIVVDIKPFRLIFSYNDVKIMMNAAQQWAVMHDVTMTVEDTTSLGWDTTDETSRLGSDDGPGSFTLTTSNILDDGSDISDESDQWEEAAQSDAGPLSEDSTTTGTSTESAAANTNAAPTTPRQQSQTSIVSESKDEPKDENLAASSSSKRKDKKDKSKDKNAKKKEREKEKKEKKEREKEKKNEKKDNKHKSAEPKSQPGSMQGTPAKKDKEPDSGPLSIERMNKQLSSASIASVSAGEETLSRASSGTKLDVPQVPAKNQKIVIQPHSFEILFIDDVKGIDIPLFRIFVTKWFGHVLDWSAQLQLAAALQMHVVYFNSDLDTWEPFIEPWEVEFRKTGIETEISSRELMNLNFTKNLLRTVQSAYKSWTADLGGMGPTIEELPSDRQSLTKSQKDDALSITGLHRNVRSTESTLSITRHEFYIQNLTGVLMTYRVGKDDPVALKTRKKQPLVAGRSNRRSSTLTNTINNRLSTKNKRMVVSLNIEGYGEIKNANIQNVGKFAATAENGKRIIYTVSYHKGSKIVTVTSPVLVENKTSVPVNVLVEVKDSDMKPIELPTIQPGKSEPVPITTVTDAVLRFRPADGYQWSRVSCYVPKLEASVKQIQCEPKSSRDRPFLFTVNVDKDFSQELKDYHVISLTTPLIIENLLPVKMEYKVCDKKGGALLHIGELEKGAQTPVHHFEAQQELALTVRIPGFDWSEKEPILCHKSKDLSDTLAVDDKNNKSLYLSLDNVEADGTRKVTVYSPFWIINRTGLPLAFGEHREELAAGQEEDATETWELNGEPRDTFFEEFFNSTPQMFSLRDSSNKLHVKLANSVWSRGIGLQNASHTTAYLQMPEKRRDGDREPGRLYELSVVEYSAKNDFWRTKVVAFAPRFVLLNKMSKTLFCKQSGTMDVFSLLPNERVPFHWTNNNISEKKLQVRLDQNDCNWAAGFTLADFGFFPVQMLDEETFEQYILQVKFQIENGIVYVVFTQDAKNELYMIQNRLDVDILITQKDSGIKPIKLTAGKSQPWGWFDPDGTRQIEIKLPNYPHRISHHIDKIKEHAKTHKYKDYEGKWKRAYVRIKAVNGTRILQVRIFRKKAQLKKDKLKEEEKETNKFIVSLKGVGLSIINERPEELLYFTLEGIRVELLTFPSKSSIEVNVKDCQIDNQIVTTYHPVLLFSPAENPPQFFKFTFIKNTRHSHLTYIEYFSILMREVNICVDEELVLRMLSFVDVIIEGLQEKSPTEIEEVTPLESSITETSYTEMIYTELFHLNPIKLNFTFTAIKGDDEESKQNNLWIYTSIAGLILFKNRNNIARIILKIPDKLIPNVDNAPLNLNALLMSHSFITKTELTARLAEHYRTKFMRQLYKILGSFDALGNPVSFVKNMGAGVHDLFYEPAKGMTVSAKEFGKGLGRGAASLVKKSVYAIFNSASKITGSISKGVAILSMDNQYQQKRQVEKFRQRPRNAIEGIGYGLKDLGTGIFKGLYGILEQPVKGGMAEGAKGVFKGIGRGFVGVVIKPTVGGIDFVQRTMEGVKNTTTLDEKVAVRKRPPRYLNSSTKLRVYSAYEAQGQDLLHSLGSSGEYWDHIYWYHEEFDRKRVFLVSDKAIFIIKKKKIEWRHSFGNLIDVQKGPEPNQITLTISKKSLLESSPDKTVNCQSEEQANKVYKTVMDLWEKFKHIQEQNALSIESNKK